MEVNKGVAFNHDNPNYLLNPVVPQEKKGRLGKMLSTRARIVTFVVLLFGVLFLIYWNTGRKQGGATDKLEAMAEARKTSRPSVVEQPTEKWLTIDENSWQGISNMDPSQKIVGTIITPDVDWQVRLDRDDNQIYTLFAGNLRPNSRLILPESSIDEWRIAPGQTNGIKTATIVARIVPRNTSH